MQRQKFKLIFLIILGALLPGTSFADPQGELKDWMHQFYAQYSKDALTQIAAAACVQANEVGSLLKLAVSDCNTSTPIFLEPPDKSPASPTSKNKSKTIDPKHLSAQLLQELYLTAYSVHCKTKNNSTGVSDKKCAAFVPLVQPGKPIDLEVAKIVLEREAEELKIEYLDSLKKRVDEARTNQNVAGQLAQQLLSFESCHFLPFEVAELDSLENNLAQILADGKVGDTLYEQKGVDSFLQRYLKKSSAPKTTAEAQELSEKIALIHGEHVLNEVSKDPHQPNADQLIHNVDAVLSQIESSSASPSVLSRVKELKAKLASLAPSGTSPTPVVVTPGVAPVAVVVAVPTPLTSPILHAPTVPTGRWVGIVRHGVDLNADVIAETPDHLRVRWIENGSSYTSWLSKSEVLPPFVKPTHPNSRERLFQRGKLVAIFADDHTPLSGVVREMKNGVAEVLYFDQLGQRHVKNLTLDELIPYDAKIHNVKRPPSPKPPSPVPVNEWQIQKVSDYISRGGAKVAIDFDSPDMKKALDGALARMKDLTHIDPASHKGLTQDQKDLIYRTWATVVAKDFEDPNLAEYANARDKIISDGGGKGDLGKILLNKAGVCRELSLMAHIVFAAYGIPSQVVTGSLEGGGHAWVQTEDGRVVDSNYVRDLMEIEPYRLEVKWKANVKQEAYVTPQKITSYYYPFVVKAKFWQTTHKIIPTTLAA